MLGERLFSGKDNLMITGKQIDVLEQPYPLNYPSTNPKPNRVIAVLEKGEKVEVVNDRYGKNYLVYKIHLKDGRTGYVIYEKDAFRVESPGDR